MVNLRRSVLDVSYVELLTFIKNQKKEKELSDDELEIILTKVLLDIKMEKEVAMSSEIINLTYQLQQMEKEKKKIVQEQAIQIKEEKKED